MNALLLALLLGGSTPCSPSPTPTAGASATREKAGKQPQATPKPCPIERAEVPEVDAAVEGIRSSIGPSDNDVVLAALLDLLTYKGEDSPIGGFGPSEPLWFDRNPKKAKSTPRATFTPFDPAAWKRLSAPQKAGARSALTNAFARVAGIRGEFTIQNSRISTRPQSKEQRSPFDPWPIAASAPGYSSGGKYAVVSLQIPWSIHVVSTTQVLELRGVEWVVVYREFLYYL